MAQEAVASVSSLAEELQRSKEQVAANRTLLAEQSDELSLLRAARRCSLSEQGWRVHRERGIVFNPQDSTSFADTDAGRKEKSRAIRAIENELLRQCAPKRGHAPSTVRTATGTLVSASVTKRKAILRVFFSRMVNAESGEASGGFSAVIDHLPRILRKHLRTLVYIKNRLKSAFAILKTCNGKEVRENYYVLSTAVAAEPVPERDKSGMQTRVTKELGIPRAPGSVPHKQQAVRAAWDKLVGNSAPIAVGEEAECSQGRGTVEELHDDGRISVNIAGRGETVKFTSQGASIPPHTCPPPPSPLF